MGGEDLLIWAWYFVQILTKKKEARSGSGHQKSPSSTFLYLFLLYMYIYHIYLFFSPGGYGVSSDCPGKERGGRVYLNLFWSIPALAPPKSLLLPEKEGSPSHCLSPHPLINNHPLLAGKPIGKNSTLWLPLSLFGDVFRGAVSRLSWAPVRKAHGQSPSLLF